MDEQEKKLIMQLAMNRISRDQFIACYPIDLIEDPNYFPRELESAFDSKDKDAVEYVLLVAGHLGKIDPCLPSLRRLLPEEWHNQHEVIIDILASVKDPSDADLFCSALSTVYPYIDGVEDFMVPIWVKCIWALGSLGTPEARECLSEALESPYEGVRDAAARQFERNEWD
jgi:HEAT repeat protein